MNIAANMTAVFLKNPFFVLIVYLRIYVGLPLHQYTALFSVLLQLFSAFFGISLDILCILRYNILYIGAAFS